MQSKKYLATSSLYKMSTKKKLPFKICQTCNLEFNWRKKWKRDWDNVKYCSERCRRNKK